MTRKQSAIWLSVVAIAALLIGISIGGNSKTIKTTTTPGPERVVNNKAVPESCLKALDLADAGFKIAGRAMGDAANALNAVAAFDIPAIQEATKRIGAANAELTDTGPRYTAAKAECRSAAK